jgi:hypothetical protein
MPPEGPRIMEPYLYIFLSAKALRGAWSKSDGSLPFHSHRHFLRSACQPQPASYSVPHLVFSPKPVRTASLPRVCCGIYMQTQTCIKSISIIVIMIGAPAAHTSSDVRSIPTWLLSAGPHGIVITAQFRVSPTSVRYLLCGVPYFAVCLLFSSLRLDGYLTGPKSISAYHSRRRYYVYSFF